MYVLVSFPFETEEEVIQTKSLKEVWEIANFSRKNSEIIAEYTLNELRTGFNLVLGNKTKTFSNLLRKEVVSRPLFPATYYNISIVLKNEFMNKSTYNVYHIFTHTGGIRNVSSSNTLLWISIIIAPLALIGLMIIFFK